MIAIARWHAPEVTTSASGSTTNLAPDAAPADGLLIATALPGPATAGTYVHGSAAMWATVARCTERTTTGPAGQIGQMNPESVAEAVMEIRRRSGLTWEELGDLFNVSLRSVHHWANGKPVSAKNGQMIRKMLAALRDLDRGNQKHTRTLLLTTDECRGISTFELLRGGQFLEATRRVEGVPTVEPRSAPLSDSAREARRPPSPTLLLEAEQERPDIPANARAARPRRASKTRS